MYKTIICCFLGYFSHRFYLPTLESAVWKFWKPSGVDNTFSFSDVKGNIFLKRENSSFEKILSSNIPNLNYFHTYNSNSYLFQYEKQHQDMKHTCYVDLNSNGWKDFEWTNTSALEYIHKNTFFRYDYFGNVCVYPFKEEKKVYRSLNFGKFEHIQSIHHDKDNFLYILNNMNVFRIYRVCENSFESSCIYENKLMHRKLTKKILTSSKGQTRHILFFYNDNSLDIFSYSNDATVTLSTVRLPGSTTIVDAALQKDFLLVSGKKSLHLYKFIESQKTGFEKIAERIYNDMPIYYTEIFWHGNCLYFNEEDCMVMIQIDVTKYNETFPLVINN
jgi:hypothetical protein